MDEITKEQRALSAEANPLAGSATSNTVQIYRYSLRNATRKVQAASCVKAEGGDWTLTPPLSLRAEGESAVGSWE